MAAILVLAAACSTTSPPPRTAAPEVKPADVSSRATLQRERSRWVAADWSELPGWGNDRVMELWPALLRSCERPASGWAETCARATLAAAPANDEEVRLWLMQHLRPWRIESHEGQTEGLLTGYYEPVLTASRLPVPGFQVPLLAAPADLMQRRPYPTRREIESEPLKSRLKAIAYIEDPIDQQLLQLQGSGRVLIDGQWRRMAFAGHNDHPLRPLGRSLADIGEWTEGPSAPRPVVREWVKRNPQRLNELMWNNPRYVFFREEPLPDPSVGPKGAQGVPLTPARSVAVDKASVPYGTPIWLDTQEPGGAAPLQRLVMAQDTGGSIIGAVRADFFWGWGAEPEALANRTYQKLRAWALWPRE